MLLGGDRHDVTEFRFDIVSVPGDCASGPIIGSTTRPLEDEHLPANQGLGDSHFFADGLFVLPPGRYAVCAAPLQADGSPSLDFTIDAAIDRSDNIVVSGYYNSPTIVLAPPSIALTNAGDYDNFVIKFSGVDGDPMWALGVGGPGRERSGAAVAVNAADQIAVVGSFTSPSVSLPSSVPGRLDGTAGYRWPVHRQSQFW